MVLLRLENLNCYQFYSGLIRAKGADQFADRWAKARMIPVKVFRPDYNMYNHKVAPLVRNDVMVELCDVCVAIFKGSKTGGTLYTARAANARKKLIGKTILE